MYEYKLMLDKASRHPFLVKGQEILYPDCRRMTNPEAFVDMMKFTYHLDALAEETLYMVTVNTRCDATGIFMIGKGDVNSCICSPRDIMTRALLAGATGIVLVHNHPSGDPTPSDTDRTVAKRVATVASLAQIQLLDSLIVGSGSFYSTHQADPDTLKPMEVQL